MCMGSGTPAVKQVEAVPEAQDAGVIASRDNERLAKRKAASNTILTGPLGTMTQAPTVAKTLLGQ